MGAGASNSRTRIDPPLAQRKATIREISSRVLIGCILCLPLAYVVLRGFLSNPEFGHPFALVNFLRQ
ncbi:hypothetical protein ACQ86E_09055 [Bradyrhizobium betae]|uniref:hypothetical protein n=1 Tax=Bradyrhizobium betae TaxID=244734 RepID=UPI003D66CC30